MSRTSFRAIVLLVACAAVTVSAMTARAVVVAEWDFRVNEDMITAGGTGSADSTLQNGATVNTGAAVPYGGASTKLRNGYLDTSRFLGTGVNAGLTSNSAWQDYFGTTAFTDATVLMVVKPYLNASQRATWFSHRVQAGNNGQVWLFTEHTNTVTGTDFIHLRVGSDSNTASVGGGGFDLNSSKWYFVGATWDAGGSAELYVREVATSSTILAGSTPGPVANATGQMTIPFHVGVRHSQFASGLSEAGDAQIAYVLINDQYSTTADFNNLFAQLVPEPASLSLLAAGILFCRRRR